MREDLLVVDAAERERVLDWDEVAGIVEDAYADVAPARLVEAARRRTDAT